jgi:tetratricopeptide (TPR) repeat protein
MGILPMTLIKIGILPMASIHMGKCPCHILATGLHSWLFLESLAMPRTQRMDQLEALLAEEPDDAFLRYGLAMEHSSQGDDATAAKLLEDLIALKRNETPYIPAYLQCGQVYMRLGQDSTAIGILKEGVQMAQKVGDQHASGEMQGLLSTLE